METFDALYEAQLNELMGSLGRRLGNKIGAMPDKLLAKFGSKTAKGKLTHRALVAKLHDEFREFCGEQGIRQPLRDDVLTFIRNRLDFKLDDATMASLSYGTKAGASPENKDDVETNLQLVAASLDKGQAPHEAVLKKLVQLAKAGTGNEVLIRSSLFRLARQYPSMSRALAGVKEYVGSARIDAQKLNMLFERIARLILMLVNKNRSMDAPEDDATKTSAVRLGQGSAVNDNLDEGTSAGSGIQNIRDNHGEAFIEELNSYGISARMWRSLGESYENDPQALVNLLNSHYSDEMCAKIARCVMQLFFHPVARKSLPKLLKPLLDKAAEAGLSGYDQMFETALRMMSAPGYDKGKVNKLIYSKVKGEDMAAGFLARVIIAAYDVDRTIGQTRK